MGFAIEKTYTAKTIERKLYKLSIKNFNSFKRQVMKNLKKADKTFNKHLKKQMPLAAIDIIMPDIGDVQHKWENTFEPLLEEEYQEVGNTALRKLRKRTKKYQYETKEAEDIFNVANPMTSQTIKHQVNKIVGASDKVYNKLKDEMMVDLLNGENIQKLQDTVTSVMNKTPMEAMRIARTESNRVANIGAYHSYEAEDLVVGYEWLSIVDNNTRDGHGSLNGTTILKGESFTNPATNNSLTYPLDEAAPAEEVVNCRCTALPLLDEKEIAEGLPEEVVAVEAPQIMPTGAGATWNTTNKEEVKWHKNSGWGDKTKQQKQVRVMIEKSDTLPKITQKSQSKAAYFNWKKSIEMGKKLTNPKDTWRHEFGHFMDNNTKFSVVYGKKVLEKTGKLPAGYGGIATGYNPASMAIDEATGLFKINKTFGANLSANLAEDILEARKRIDRLGVKSNGLLDKIGDKDYYGRTFLKKDKSKKILDDLGFETKWNEKPTIRTSAFGKEVVQDPTFKLEKVSIAKGTKKEMRDRVKKFLDEGDGFVKVEDMEAILGRSLDKTDLFDDFEFVERIITSHTGNPDENLKMLYKLSDAGDLPVDRNIFRHKIGTLDDSIGAATRNRYGGVFFGHDNKYYQTGFSLVRGVKENQAAEIFTEYIEVLTNNNTKMGDGFLNLYKRILPETSKKMDELIEFVSETDFSDWEKFIIE